MQWVKQSGLLRVGTQLAAARGAPMEVPRGFPARCGVTSTVPGALGDGERGKCQGAGAGTGLGWQDTAPASHGSLKGKSADRREHAKHCWLSGGSAAQGSPGAPRHGAFPPATPCPRFPSGCLANLVRAARPRVGTASPESPPWAGVQAPLRWLQGWLLFS